MKYLQTLFILLITINLCAQPTAPNLVDSQGRKQGKWVKYNEKKELLYEGAFKNDIPVGNFTYYHPNGKIKSTTTFIEGVHKVQTTLFHNNEKVASEGMFIDQQKDGEWNYWNENGTLIKIENYKLGKKEGKWITFSSETGIALEEQNYVDNLLHGEYKTYYTNGNISLIENYVSGKRNGEILSYYFDNKPCIKGFYHNNLKTGTWEFYNMDGILKKSVEYLNYQQHKIYLHFNNSVRNPGIKLLQDNIAYFYFDGNKVILTSKTGQNIQLNDSMESIKMWADILNFTVVLPNLYVANDAIRGYEELEDEEDVILVKVSPAFPFEIKAEGNEAKAVRSLFDTTKIKAE